MQLDIFADNRDVMLRNDVLEAVQRYDAQLASHTLAALTKAYSDDQSLPRLQVLVDALVRRASEPLIDCEAVSEMHRQYLAEVEPAAMSFLGNRKGHEWMARLWSAVGDRALKLPFRADKPDAHAAPLYLLAGRWDKARDAVATIDSWRRIPAPLMWMAEAGYRVEGLDTAWPLICELAWLSPARFDALLHRLNDPALLKLRKTFDASIDLSDESNELASLSWFRAWLLTQKAGLASVLRQCQCSRGNAPERGLTLMLKLLLLEREGRHWEVLASRRELQVLHSGLYAIYLQTR